MKGKDGLLAVFAFFHVKPYYVLYMMLHCYRRN